MKIVIFMVIACTFAQEECSDSDLAIFKRWQKDFNQPPQEDEVEEKKCIIIKKALEHIQSSNKDHRKHKSGLHEYSDLTEEEITNTRYGYLESEGEYVPGLHRLKRSYSYPPSRDWRDEKIITPVKNQGRCGSCWSFPVTGVIESYLARKNGKLVSLSEQNIIDCDKRDKGCKGGHPTWGYEFVKKQGGLDSERSYPFVSGITRVAGTCNFKPKGVVAKITGFHQLHMHDTEAMLDVVGNKGPLAVAIDATGPHFHHYKKGIYNNPNCSNTKLNHAVLIVGYGTDRTNSTGLGDIDYWIVKNQWGTTWGDKGYIYMARDTNVINNCGISKRPSFVTV